MTERRFELEREFVEKAIERREQTIQLQKEIKSKTDSLLGMINSGRNEDALKFLEDNLFNEGPLDGIFPGSKEEEFMTYGVLDTDKVRRLVSTMNDAVQERIEEIDESMKDGWEEKISEMLEAPFVEIDQLLVQYCYGDESIRTPFQILEDSEAHWDAEFEWRKNDIGAIKRVDPEKT